MGILARQNSLHFQPVLEVPIWPARWEMNMHAKSCEKHNMAPVKLARRLRLLCQHSRTASQDSRPPWHSNTLQIHTLGSKAPDLPTHHLPLTSHSTMQGFLSSHPSRPRPPNSLSSSLLCLLRPDLVMCSEVTERYHSINATKNDNA